MNIAITGGSGFVGSSLGIYLKNRYPNYSVVAFDSLRRRGSELNLARLREYGVRFVHGDIRNAEDLDQLGDCDVIIDASADPSVLSGIHSPVLPLINANLVGTVNLLEYCVEVKSKVLFLSTSRVYPVKSLEAAGWIEYDTRYGWKDEQELPGISSFGVSEIFPMAGARSFYGATKLASELLITEYAEHKGVQAIINRCGVISGPWQMGKIDQGVLILWLARHYFRGKLSYIGYDGTGKQTRDVLHVDDLSELIDYQIHNFDLFSGEVMNVGGGLEISFSLQELTRICEEVTGNIIDIDAVKEGRAADLRIYIGDNSRIQALCGWKPKRSLRQVLEDSYIWMRSNEAQLKPVLQ